MQVYTFELKDGGVPLSKDRSGVHLPDRDRAFRYALDVAHELMSCREAQTRLDVYSVKGRSGRHGRALEAALLPPDHRRRN